MLLFGLILGLGIAAGVAWFVTQVPMPFTDKFSRADPTKPLPDPRTAPDPNQALSGRTDASGTAPDNTGKAPAASGGVSLQDDIGALLTTLGAPAGGSTPSTSGTAPAAATAPAKPSAAATNAPATGTTAAPPGTSAPTPSARSSTTPSAASGAEPSAGNQTTYYLQAGAFRAEADAQAMQARILMLGMQSNIQPVQSNGTTLYRVRVGPFKGIDAMNKSRATLSNAKIETSVVRP